MLSVPLDLRELYEIVGESPFTANTLPKKFRLRWLYSNGYLKSKKNIGGKRTPRTYTIADLYLIRIKAEDLINDPEILNALETKEISIHQLSVMTGLTRSTLTERLKQKSPENDYQSV